MQVKKEELRESIVKVAEKEFANKGFKASSMRVIAKKSNTTLGNLYNYFENKEALLDEVIGTTVEEIEAMFTEHTQEKIEIYDFELLNRELKKADVNKLGFNIFLSQKFIILMEGAEGTKFEGYRKSFLKKCKEHFLWHLDKSEGNSNFIEIVASAFINGILFIAKRNKDGVQAKEDFIKLYQLICSGMISQCKIRGDLSDRSK